MNNHLFEQARAFFLEGVSHYEAGQYRAAAEAFDASLTLMPGRVSTLANLGAAQVKLGQPEAALRTLDAALAQAPEHADAWCHRGAACVLLGRDQDALAAFERALALGVDTLPVRLEHALLLNRSGRHEEGLTALNALLALRPHDGQLHLLRGQTLQHLGRHDEAFDAYERAVQCEPGLGLAWSLRGHLLRRLGRLAEAGTSFERAIAAGDDPAGNRYFLSAVGVGAMPSTAPPSYVRGLFDDYADRFDEHLLQALHYRAPKAIVAAVTALGRGTWQSTLDIGCGSGLAAPLLRQITLQLSGIDLSPRMIDLASKTGLYDTLAVADLHEHLQTTPQRHDLVVCCDVFGYIGDLAPAFAGVQRVLVPGGVFGFCVEAGEAPGGFELRPSLRYAHSEAYLRGLAAAHGFDVLRVERGPLRENRGEPIEGIFMQLGRR